MNIGIIGCGNMGKALVEGLLKKIKPENIIIYDIDSQKQKIISEKYNVFTCKNEVECIEKAELLILAVKPNEIESVLLNIKDYISYKIIISIAAGITTKFIKDIVGEKKIVRIMPNVNISIQKGVMGFCHINLNQDDINIIKDLFKNMGDLYEIDEKYFDAVTALVGSGPAFIAYIIESLSDAALKLGIPKTISINMINNLIIGTVENMKINQIHPSIFKDIISSPAGTTIEGLIEMEKYGVKNGIINAVLKASERAEKLKK